MINIMVSIMVLMAVSYLGAFYVQVIYPTQAIHYEMRKSRDQILLKIAAEVQRLQNNVPSLMLEETPHRLQQLTQVEDEIQRLIGLHRAVLGTNPIWPISLRWFRGIEISTAIPLVDGVAPLVIKWIVER